MQAQIKYLLALFPFLDENDYLVDTKHSKENVVRTLLDNHYLLQMISHLIPKNHYLITQHVCEAYRSHEKLFLLFKKGFHFLLYIIKELKGAGDFYSLHSERWCFEKLFFVSIR